MILNCPNIISDPYILVSNIHNCVLVHSIYHHYPETKTLSAWSSKLYFWSRKACKCLPGCSCMLYLYMAQSFTLYAVLFVPVPVAFPPTLHSAWFTNAGWLSRLEPTLVVFSPAGSLSGATAFHTTGWRTPLPFSCMPAPAFQERDLPDLHPGGRKLRAAFMYQVGPCSY